MSYTNIDLLGRMGLSDSTQDALMAPISAGLVGGVYAGAVEGHSLKNSVIDGALYSGACVVGDYAGDMISPQLDVVKPLIAAGTYAVARPLLGKPGGDFLYSGVKAFVVESAGRNLTNAVNSFGVF
jgi:hypothetical protein